MVISGMVGSSVYGQKKDFQLTPGQSAEVAGHKLTYVAMHETRHANYMAVQAEMTVRAADGSVKTLRPQRRFYDKSEQPNSEVALSSNLRRDVYLTLAGWEQGGRIVAVQAIVNPLVSWIWIGGLVMSVGAVFCLLPRLIPQAESAPAATQERPRVRMALAGSK
jgi:cytochrome c-type biogenesis protein CcmF